VAFQLLTLAHFIRGTRVAHNDGISAHRPRRQCDRDEQHGSGASYHAMTRSAYYDSVSGDKSAKGRPVIRPALPKSPAQPSPPAKCYPAARSQLVTFCPSSILFLFAAERLSTAAGGLHEPSATLDPRVAAFSLDR
jgi:hypothetical protein